jgi:hypothetical protein
MRLSTMSSALWFGWRAGEIGPPAEVGLIQDRSDR